MVRSAAHMVLKPKVRCRDSHAAEIVLYLFCIPSCPEGNGAAIVSRVSWNSGLHEYKFQ